MKRHDTTPLEPRPSPSTTEDHPCSIPQQQPTPVERRRRRLSVRQTSRQQTIINEWQRRLCHSSALPWARSCRRRNCCFPHSLQYSGGGHPAPIPVGVFPRSQLLFLILLVEVCSRTEPSSAKVVLHRSAITVVSVPLITWCSELLFRRCRKRFPDFRDPHRSPLLGWCRRTRQWNRSTLRDGNKWSK